MPKYQVQIYEAEDVFTTYSMPANDLDGARVRIKEMSKERELPMILISSKAWERYENGELAEKSDTELADEPIG